MTVTVPTGLEVIMPLEPSACPGDDIILSPTSVDQGIEPYIYEWIDANGNTWNTENISITVDEALEYCLTVTDQCGEVVTECTTVVPFEIIPASFTIDTTLACEPLTVDFLANTQNLDQVASMTWYFDDGDAESSVPGASHTYLEGVYQPYMVLETNDGCIYSDTLENPLIVFPMPMASFDWAPDVAVLPSTTFEFENLSIDAGIYEWNFADLDVSTEDEPEYAFPEEQTGQYLVYLIASNQWGCVDSTAAYLLIIDEMVIYAPNAFTPDGDGINDVWQISGKGFSEELFSVMVFDRWGNIVFESNDPGFAWMGNMIGGEHFVQNDVYPYVIEVLNAQTGTMEKIKGHVVMMR
jgi:gliding motility-associated-like protein